MPLTAMAIITAETTRTFVESGKKSRMKRPALAAIRAMTTLSATVLLFLPPVLREKDSLPRFYRFWFGCLIMLIIGWIYLLYKLITCFLNMRNHEDSDLVETRNSVATANLVAVHLNKIKTNFGSMQK